MQRNIVAAAALALAFAGCLESRQGTRAGDVSPGDTAAADTLVPQDSAPADTHERDGDEELRCDQVYFEESPAAHTAPYTPWHLVTGVDGRITFSGGEWRYGEPPGVWRLDAKTGEAVTVPGTEENDVLVDADGGAILLLRGGADGAARRLVYHDDAHEVVLTHPEADGERVLGDPFDYGATGEVVADGWAAWRSCDDDAQHRCVRSRLRGWAGGVTETLWEAAASPALVTPPQPEVDAAGVLWAEPPRGDPQRWRIRSWSGDASTMLQEVDATAIYRVARLDGDLVWWADTGFWRARGDGPAERLSDLVCGAIDSDGSHAVMLCEAADADGDGIIDAASTPFPHARGELWLYDRWDGLRRVPTEGAIRVVPRVWGGVLAWLTYDDEGAGCYPESIGAVMVAPVEAPDAAVRVASIGVGCYCCDSIWPEVRLSLYGGTVAWNYAVTGEEPAPDPRGGGLGWAQPLLQCH